MPILSMQAAHLGVAITGRPGADTGSEAILGRSGEAGRFEFKSDERAVTPKVLVAAANACIIERLESVTILLGVSEDQDHSTGAVTGRVVGISTVDRIKGQLRARARSTGPVPVGVELYEEYAELSLAPGL